VRRPARPTARALRACQHGHHTQTVRGMAQWRAGRRLSGGSTTARCCRRSRGGHEEGAGQGGEGRGVPKRRVDGEAAQMASGGGVRRWGCSGGRRRARRGPAAPVREGEAKVSPNLGNGEARRALTGEGRTAATLGRSPARRRGSGGGKPVRRTPGLWERRRGARAWMGETVLEPQNSIGILSEALSFS
jgi:hypothetical protein